MARATMLSDRGFERDYQIQNNRIITIKIDDFDGSVSYFENGNRIGNYDDFVFKPDSEDDFNGRCLLARMYVPITKAGLGRATIEHFKSIFDATVYARTNDGIELNDGSHLTEDAPAFVDKMIEEGLLEDNRERPEY